MLCNFLQMNSPLNILTNLRFTWPSQFLKVSVVGQTQAQSRYLPGQLHWLSLKWLPPFPFLAVSPAPSTASVRPHRQIHWHQNQTFLHRFPISKLSKLPNSYMHVNINWQFFPCHFISESCFLELQFLKTDNTYALQMCTNSVKCDTFVTWAKTLPNNILHDITF